MGSSETSQATSSKQWWTMVIYMILLLVILIAVFGICIDVQKNVKQVDEHVQTLEDTLTLPPRSRVMLDVFHGFPVDQVTMNHVYKEYSISLQDNFTKSPLKGTIVVHLDTFKGISIDMNVEGLELMKEPAHDSTYVQTPGKGYLIFYINGIKIHNTKPGSFTISKDTLDNTISNMMYMMYPSELDGAFKFTVDVRRGTSSSYAIYDIFIDDSDICGNNWNLTVPVDDVLQSKINDTQWTHDIALGPTDWEPKSRIITGKLTLTRDHETDPQLQLDVVVDNIQLDQEIDYEQLDTNRGYVTMKVNKLDIESFRKGPSTYVIPESRLSELGDVRWDILPRTISLEIHRNVHDTYGTYDIEF